MNPKYLIAAFGALTAALAACGTTNNNIVAKCGAGTRLQGDTCVSDLPDTGIAADTGTAAEDAGSVADTGADSGVEPDLPDEPCPVPRAGMVILNCDATCGAVDEAGCARVLCPETIVGPRQGVTYALNPYEQDRTLERWVLRLPRDPWLTYGTCYQGLNPPQSPGGVTYVPQDPQPKFWVRFNPSGHQQTPSGSYVGERFNVDARRYLSRITQHIFKSREADPLQSMLVPLAKEGRGGAQDTSKSGCRNYNTATLMPQPTLQGNGSRSNVIFSTSALTIPATNLIVNTDEYICAGQP